MDSKSLAHSGTEVTVEEAIRLDAAARPGSARTYREHIAAAEEVAAVEYRREIRRMMAAGTLDPSEADADEL